MSSASGRRDGPAPSEASRCVSSAARFGSDGQRIVRGLVLQTVLLRAAFADVAHDGGVQPFGVEPHAAHGDLHREHLAVEGARVALADHAVQRAEPCAGASPASSVMNLAMGSSTQLVDRRSRTGATRPDSRS